VLDVAEVLDVCNFRPSNSQKYKNAAGYKVPVIKRVVWDLVSVSGKVFWNVTPCSLVNAYQYFWWNLTVYLILEHKDVVSCGTGKQYLSKWGECVCQYPWEEHRAGETERRNNVFRMINYVLASTDV